jgi:phospholipid/cholesterol/gamma-HCH transport system substrate-binding protein
MNESSNKRAVIVGVFVLVGLLALLAGILTIGNLHATFTRKMKVVSVFEDVNGLLPGSNVWFSGVKIGTVKTLKFKGKSQVEVIMNIDENAQQYIREDAKVKISTDGLIGNKIIVIFGGTSNAPEVKEGDTLRVETMLSTDDIMKTLQENNKNVLEITKDFKTISKKLANGEGSLGKLMANEDIYNNINATTRSLQLASKRTEQLTASLADFTKKLNKDGTLMNELVTDTVLFKSMSSSILELEMMADTASIMVNELKTASNNPKSAIGVLLYDQDAGKDLKGTIKNLESSTQKLDEDLEALKESFLLRGVYKKRAKKESKKQKRENK